MKDVATKNTGIPANYNQSVRLIETTPVENCPVCGSNRSANVADGFDYELQTCANLWRFVQCRECECIRLNPRPAASELGTIYPPHYYSYSMEDQLNPIAVWGKRVLDKLKFGSILKTMPAEPTSFLDVGFGDGRYLQLFARRGIDRKNIYGLELSAPPVEKLRAEGFQVYNERIEDASMLPSGRIDLISMFHVIEHVEDPAAVLARLHNCLSAQGVLALETPNINASDFKLFRRRWWGGYHTPRHWTLFNEISMKRLLQQNGFKVLSIEYQTGHSFWMYSFHHWLRYNETFRLPRIARWFDPMLGLLPLIFFTGIDTARRLLGFRTSAMLVIAQKEER